jgi:hypothetical protein
LQNCIIFLLLYQKFIIISDVTTNPPATVIVDRARGSRGRGRGNYHSKKKAVVDSGTKFIIIIKEDHMGIETLEK